MSATGAVPTWWELESRLVIDLDEEELEDKTAAGLSSSQCVSSESWRSPLRSPLRWSSPLQEKTLERRKDTSSQPVTIDLCEFSDEKNLPDTGAISPQAPDGLDITPSPSPQRLQFRLPLAVTPVSKIGPLSGKTQWSRSALVESSQVSSDSDMRTYGEDGRLLRMFVARNLHTKAEARELAVDEWMIRRTFYDRFVDEFSRRFGPNAPAPITDASELSRASLTDSETAFRKKPVVDELKKQVLQSKGDKYVLRDVLLSAVEKLIAPKSRLGLRGSSKKMTPEVIEILKQRKQYLLRSVIHDCLEGIWKAGAGGEILKAAMDVVRDLIDRFESKAGDVRAAKSGTSWHKLKQLVSEIEEDAKTSPTTCGMTTNLSRRLAVTPVNVSSNVVSKLPAKATSLRRASMVAKAASKVLKTKAKSKYKARAKTQVDTADGPPGEVHWTLRAGLVKAFMQRLRFRGLVARKGTTKGRRWKRQTILLRDIESVEKIVVDGPQGPCNDGYPATTDHLWLKVGKRLAEMRLEPGDLVEFDARVRWYRKRGGYDLKLSHASKIAKVGKVWSSQQDGHSAPVRQGGRKRRRKGGRKEKVKRLNKKGGATHGAK